MANSRALEEPGNLSSTNWDLYLDGDNRIARVVDEERVRQNLRERLQTFLGEWFQDATIGVPWFQRIFVKPANFGVTESIIKSTILDTPGVVELLEFKFEADAANRVIKVLSFTVNTVYGQIEESL